MKRTAVYIATTEGPSEIQRITPEDPDVRSVVCHDGKAIALPISADYDSFVRRPTGVIEACFGHGPCRVDVGEPIASGLSWQLGLFIAHALFDEGRLVRADDRNPQIVWATGEVTRDLAVAAVDDLDRKIRRAAGCLREHLDGGSKVVIAVPAANLAETEKALAGVFGDRRDRLHVVFAETVCDVLAALGLKQPKRVRQWLARTPAVIRGRRKLPRPPAYAISLVLLAVTAAVAWQRLRPETVPHVAQARALPVIPASLRTEAAPSLAAAAVAVRAPADAPCAAVDLDRVAPLVTSFAAGDGAPAAGLRAAGLCDFHYRLTNRSDGPALLWVMAARAGAGGEKFRLRSFHAEQPVAARQSIDLDARPPRGLAAPLHQSFLVLSLPAGSAAGVGGMRALWRRALRAQSAGELDRIAAEARTNGAGVLLLAGDFTP